MGTDEPRGLIEQLSAADVNRAHGVPLAHPRLARVIDLLPRMAAEAGGQLAQQHHDL